MKSKLRAAFHGLSPDRVVADPHLNAAFLDECRRLGLTQSALTLNKTLLNLRKEGDLRGLKSIRTSFPDEDQYRFAAEVAARFIERRDNVSLDDIIANPASAQEFDVLAAQIAPGYQSVEYRWAALKLRKASKFKPELVSRIVRAKEVKVHRVSDLSLNAIPSQQGLYVFFSRRMA